MSSHRRDPVIDLLAKTIDQNTEICDGDIFYKDKVIYNIYDLIEEKQPYLYDRLYEAAWHVINDKQ